MFENGSEWLRTDFHLHTNSDKEFKYDGDSFIRDYIDGMEENDIKFGIVTNHNKFNLHEFKALKKEAKKRQISLLPGVELSVRAGANGIHTLIVFKYDEWITSDTNYIEQFLTTTFAGVKNRENENTRCKHSLSQVIDLLDKMEHNYFIIMAHIESSSGFFNELGGGMIEQISKEEKFKNRVIGFQKAVTWDKRQLLQEWMGYQLAYVEGSDPKKISDIGKGKSVFVKLGDYSFEALKFALRDFNNRVSTKKHEITHSYIKSISCTGGRLDGQKINLSPHLNSLIGIRGSGKSSILEIIRYALNIELTNSTADKEYKDKLVENTIGSGGIVEVELLDSHNQTYYIRRIFGEEPQVFNAAKNIEQISTSSLIRNPLYFGQKDLSSPDKIGFELELLNRLIGDVRKEIIKRIETCNESLVEQIKLWKSNTGLNDKIKDLEQDNKDLDHKMKVFEEKGIAKKLEKQAAYEADREFISNIKEVLEILSINVMNIYDKGIKEQFESLKIKDSEFNQVVFNDVNNNIDEFELVLKSIKKQSKDLVNITDAVELKSKTLNDKIVGLQNEFAEIKREINVPNLNCDDYITYKTTKNKNIIEILSLKEILKTQDDLQKEILDLKKELDLIISEDYNLYQNEILNINTSQDEINVSIELKGDKVSFKSELSNVFKGSRLTDSNYQMIANEFDDFIEIFFDIYFYDGKYLRELVTERRYLSIKEIFDKDYETILKKKVDNKIEINYHGSPLSEHSLGQRASALILFILTQEDNDLILIDQPEDDLDNQVIYEELITTIKSKKKNIQFLFATHNANIPVLGDSELVLACKYGDCIEVLKGSVDVKEIQSKIVTIMEGGPIAFQKRNEIYNVWSIC